MNRHLSRRRIAFTAAVAAATAALLPAFAQAQATVATRSGRAPDATGAK